MATNPRHVYVPETNIWDVEEVRNLDPTSEEFKELIVRLYQNMNLHSMAINRNNCCDGGGGGGGCMPWTVVTERCGNTLEDCNGYVANGTLYPIDFRTAANTDVGDIYGIAGFGAPGWELYLQPGQKLYLTDTSQFIEGDVTYLRNLETRPFGGILILCIEANTTFVARFLADTEIKTIFGSFTGKFVTPGNNQFRCSVYAPSSSWWVAAGGTEVYYNNSSPPTSSWPGIIVASSSIADIDTDNNGTWIGVQDNGNFVQNTSGDPSNVLNWSEPGGTVEKGIAYGNGLWVGVGNGGDIQTSTGAGFTTRTSPTTTDMYTVRYGNGLWVMAGANGEIWTSADPTAGAASWTARASQVTPFIIRDVGFGVSCSWPNGHFVAVGDNGSITSSPDGITWTAVATAIPSIYQNLRGVRLLNNTWVASFNAGAIGVLELLQSTNPAVSWTAVSVGSIAGFNNTDRIGTNNDDTVVYGVALSGGFRVGVVAIR